MPYDWTEGPKPELNAWPYRSLSNRGFAKFFLASMAIAALPLSALLGTVVLWGILPFFILAFWGVWAALQRSFRDGEVLERLVLDPEEVTLERHEKGDVQSWSCAPYWVRPVLHRDARIESYLTLQGGAREVELGAFLTVEEREALYRDLNARLFALRQPG